MVSVPVAARGGNARHRGRRLVTERDGVCLAGLGEPHGGKPAKRRPVLVVRADPSNGSRLNTTLAAVITLNTGLAAMPGNDSSSDAPGLGVLAVRPGPLGAGIVTALPAS
jgi:hypothetical protein